jgi:solute carrier family 25 (mitochondrial folate transporter), member 32
VIERQLLLFHNRAVITNTALAFGQVSTSLFPTAQWGTAQDAPSRRQEPQRPQVAVSLSPLDYFIASGVAGLVITFSTNPIWVLKTRMLSSDRGTDGAYPSMWAGARVVWAREGWKGFYKGLGVSCLGVSHGAVQFAVYEPLKRSWLQYVKSEKRRHGDGDLYAERKEEREEGKLGNEATVLISGVAKLVAGTVTYPYQVVRSRLQTYNAEERFGKGIRGVVGRVWKEEGWRGFYKGLGPNVFRVMPATWVTFLVYENVRYYLPRWAS